MSSKRTRAGTALAAAVLAAVWYQALGTEQMPPRLATYHDGCRPAPAEVIGRIRYDSGLELGYCSLAAMFEQLVAQEQPGLIRRASVRMADGRWQDARTLRYGRDAAAWRAYRAALPADAALYSYRELLLACARRGCGAD